MNSLSRQTSGQKRHVQREVASPNPTRSSERQPRPSRCPLREAGRPGVITESRRPRSTGRRPLEFRPRTRIPCVAPEADHDHNCYLCVVLRSYLKSALADRLHLGQPPVANGSGTEPSCARWETQRSFQRLRLARPPGRSGSSAFASARPRCTLASSRIVSSPAEAPRRIAAEPWYWRAHGSAARARGCERAPPVAPPPPGPPRRNVASSGHRPRSAQLHANRMSGTARVAPSQPMEQSERAGSGLERDAASRAFGGGRIEGSEVCGRVPGGEQVIE